MNYARSSYYLLLSLALCLPSACSSSSKEPQPPRARTSTVVLQETVNELEKDPVPGTQRDVWAEPMIDTVRLPGQLDPQGIYYRKPHDTLYEIRHNKYQKVEYPNEKGEYPMTGR